jgi:ribosome-associated translation inhibitor RaiA
MRIKIKKFENHVYESPMVDLSDDELDVINDLRAKNRPKKIGSLKDRLAKRKTHLNDEDTAKKQAALDEIKVAVKALKPHYSEAVDALESYKELVDQGLLGDFKKVLDTDHNSALSVAVNHMGYMLEYNDAYPSSWVMLESRYRVSVHVLFKNGKVYLQCEDKAAKPYELTDANIDKLLPDVYWRNTDSYSSNVNPAVCLDNAFGYTTSGGEYYHAFTSRIVMACKELNGYVARFNDALAKYADELDNNG